MKLLKVDKPFLFSVLILVIFGFFIFTSASLGILARDNSKFDNISNTQLIALGLGLLGLFLCAKVIPHKFWRRYAFYIFLSTILLNLLLFIPKLGFEHGGATRWITIGSFTIQPSEFLKFGFILYFSTWLASVKDNVTKFKFGLLPFIVIAIILCPILIAQSDTKTFVIIAFSGLAMLFSAGAKWRDIGVIACMGLLFVGAVALVRPYAMERIKTFINPASDPLNSGYQIQQSLIAIGSGGMFGRGFGQSVQKFNYLPEPVGDSIFAVYAEEWGFVGSVALIFLFLFFVIRGFKIATRSGDLFGSFFIVGIVVLIVVESFMNIASMIGIIPLSGIPLLFVSHGGTALVTVLAEVGIILNISRYHKKNSI
ncbi:MAG: putative lipid II flippase FtsW [Patescibacteria group bacterium]|nr:putative lipid II flippase FtsW [Patescibacteria group bacterium]